MSDRRQISATRPSRAARARARTASAERISSPSRASRRWSRRGQARKPRGTSRYLLAGREREPGALHAMAPGGRMSALSSPRLRTFSNRPRRIGISLLSASLSVALSLSLSFSRVHSSSRCSEVMCIERRDRRHVARDETAPLAQPITRTRMGRERRTRVRNRERSRDLFRTFSRAQLRIYRGGG